jgi:hypothetical protein
MTADEFRSLVLEVPGAVEKSHMNHPDFRLYDRVFASLGAPDERWAMVKLTPEQQGAFIDRAPKVFKPCSGAWGRQGCTNVLLAVANSRIVRSAIADAANNMEARTPRRKKA